MFFEGNLSRHFVDERNFKMQSHPAKCVISAKTLQNIGVRLGHDTDIGHDQPMISTIRMIGAMIDMIFM